jgi:hypothetical protein
MAQTRCTMLDEVTAELAFLTTRVAARQSHDAFMSSIPIHLMAAPTRRPRPALTAESPTDDSCGRGGESSLV